MGETSQPTSWQVGERVIPKFWEPGDPLGTVVSVQIVKGPVQANALSKSVVDTVEWVKVWFDDGYEKEYAAWDLRKPPPMTVAD